MFDRECFSENGKIPNFKMNKKFFSYCNFKGFFLAHISVPLLFFDQFLFNFGTSLKVHAANCLPSVLWHQLSLNHLYQTDQMLL